MCRVSYYALYARSEAYPKVLHTLSFVLVPLPFLYTSAPCDLPYRNEQGRRMSGVQGEVPAAGAGPRAGGPAARRIGAGDNKR